MEKYVAIGRNIGSSYLAYLLVFVANPLLVVLLTRFLTVSEYGVFVLLNVTIGVVSVLLNFGFVEYIQTKLSGAENRYRIRVFFTLFFSNLIAVLLLFSLLLNSGFRNFVLQSLKLQGYLPEVIIATVIVILLSTIRLFNAVLQAQQRIMLQNVLATIQQVAWIFVLAVFILLTKSADLLTVMWLFLLGVIFSWFLYLRYFWKDLMSFLKIGLHSDEIRTALSFGLPIMVTTLFSWVMEVSDRYVINYYLGKEQVAIYSVAYSLLAVVFSISIILPSTLYPYFAEAWNKRKDYNIFSNLSVKYTFLLLIPSLLGFWVLRREIVTLVSGEAYLLAAAIIPVLLSYPLFASLNYLLIQRMLLSGKTKQVAGLYMLGGIVNMVLNLTLIPRIGIIGGAWATAVSYALVFLLLLWNLRGQIKIDYGFVRPLRMILASILMAIALYFIHPVVFWTKALAILGGAIFYFALLFLFNTFDPREVDVVKKLFKPIIG